MLASSRTISGFIILLMVVLLLVACGGQDDERPAPSPSAEEAPPKSVPGPGHGADQDEVTDHAGHAVQETVPDATPEPEDTVRVDDDGVLIVTVGSTDQMQYTVREFTVEAGQEVELTLTHDGRLPKQTMGHNLVILPAGEDYMAFARQVTQQGGSIDNEFLPGGLRENLIAYTRMIGGGESDTIGFTAPETPGDYPFLCTFPGHFGLMNGVMIVR